MDGIAVGGSSLIYNKPWYFFANTFGGAGTQDCYMQAYNSLGERADAFTRLIVAPASVTPSGGGSWGGGVAYDPTAPSGPYVPPPSGSGKTGQRQGYLNPTTGVVSANPDGTGTCSPCGTGDGSNVVNVGASEPAAAATGGNDGGGGTSATTGGGP